MKSESSSLYLPKQKHLNNTNEKLSSFQNPVHQRTQWVGLTSACQHLFVQVETGQFLEIPF